MESGLESYHKGQTGDDLIAVSGSMSPIQVTLTVKDTPVWVVMHLKKWMSEKITSSSRMVKLTNTRFECEQEE